MPPAKKINIPCERIIPYSPPPGCTRGAVVRSEELDALISCAEAGDIYAQARLGELYFYGKAGLPKDPVKAACWFRRAAAGGITYAQVQTGHFYRDGYGVEKNTSHAIHWYQRAAKQGDLTAMLALGDIYRGWHGPKLYYLRQKVDYQDCHSLLEEPPGVGASLAPNFAKSRHWYEKAAALGSAEAKYRLAWISVRGWGGHHCREKGLESLTTAAEQGNPDALVELGDVYLEGHLVRMDWRIARDYYLAAVENGSAEAAFKLGMIFETGGHCICKDHVKAANWFLMAAQRDYPPAQYYLASLYRDGWGIPRDYRMAAMWYKKAIDHEVMLAEADLGDLFHAGKGVPRNLEAAAYHYKLAAQYTKLPYAELMLSVMYSKGRGVPFDLAKSVMWYDCASQRPGFLMAEYQIAKRFELGFGLEKDLREAVRWLKLAANKGLAVAQVELGDLYYAGKNIKQDYDEAFDWYYKAAKQGHCYAENMVGLMLLAGQSVKVNEPLAANWIRKAAHQGARQAQYQLGLLYLQGIGVEQNYSKSFGWIKNALEDVEDKTPTVERYLVDQMSPNARREAVRLAKEYKHRYGFCLVAPKRIFDELEN